MASEPVRDTHDADSATDDHDDLPTVVLESTFPTGEVARREYPIEREAIPPDVHPELWLVLLVDVDGLLLLDTDALRAVWTGPGSSPFPSGADQ